jgi:hypothetical protein
MVSASGLESSVVALMRGIKWIGVRTGMSNISFQEKRVSVYQEAPVKTWWNETTVDYN